jgi:hypothetical protein
MPDTTVGCGELIALVGQARLLKRPDGKYELSGGREDDRTEIIAWMAAHLQAAELVT